MKIAKIKNLGLGFSKSGTPEIRNLVSIFFRHSLFGHFWRFFGGIPYFGVSRVSTSVIFWAVMITTNLTFWGFVLAMIIKSMSSYVL